MKTYRFLVVSGSNMFYIDLNLEIFDGVSPEDVFSELYPHLREHLVSVEQ